jgi:hypothetical protein
MSDRENWYYRQQVTWGEMRQADDHSEDADRYIVSDHDIQGVQPHRLFTTAQDPAGPNLNVQVSGGIAYDDLGRRLDHYGQTTLVDCAPYLPVGAGNTRGLSIAVRFKRTDSDPRVDGNGIPLDYLSEEDVEFQVYAGAEVPIAPPTPIVYPGVAPNEIQIAEVTVVFGQVSILNGDIEYGEVYLDSLSGRRQPQDVGGPRRYRIARSGSPFVFAGGMGHPSMSLGISDFDFPPAIYTSTANRNGNTANGTPVHIRYPLPKLPIDGVIKRIYVSGYQELAIDVRAALVVSVGGVSGPVAGAWSTGLGAPGAFVIDQTFYVPVQYQVTPFVPSQYHVVVECSNWRIAPPPARGDVIYEVVVEYEGHYLWPGG